MDHRKKGRKLGRRPDHRQAMLRNLAISLIEGERIETTVTRAKELRRHVDRLVTYAKRGGLHGRRLVLQALGNNRDATAKLVEEIAPRYEARPGGYTRVLKTGFRRGDAAPTALIEFVEEAMPKKRKRTGSKAKPAAKAAKPAPEPVEEPVAAEAAETKSAAESETAEAPEVEASAEPEASSEAAAEAEAPPSEPEPAAEASEPEPAAEPEAEEPAEKS